MTKPIPDITEYSQIGSLAASGTKNLGSFDIDKIRTLSVTIKGTTNASAVLPLRINLFYSPSGNVDEWDTLVFDYFDLDMTAGSNSQGTHTWQNLPETGKLRLQVENLDTGQAATDIKVWVGISIWDIMQVLGDNVVNREENKNFALINRIEEE